MAKKKTSRKRAARPTKAVKPVPVGPELDVVDDGGPVYAFASSARCPGCGDTQTAVDQTRGQVRYWFCKHDGTDGLPTCAFSKNGLKHGWKEIGTPI